MTIENELLDEVMCTCTGTTRGMIRQLFVQGMDMEAISRYSGAISGCGGCEWDVAQYLKALDEESPKA